MNKIDDLDLLEKIKKVEAPAHLWPAIQKRLTGREEVLSIRWAWTAAAAALLILCINILVMINIKRNYKQTSFEEVVSTMHLSSSNDLYYE